MKKFFCFLTCLALSVAAMAQTAEEILDKMGDIFSQKEQDGLVMTVQTKIPILGTMNMKVYSLDELSRMEATMMGANLIIWNDGVTEWTYNSKDNELEIANASPSSGEDGDADMFKDVADGYDVSIKKETAESWYIHCKKSKTNPNKDDPKSMDIVVAKGTYYPISLSTKINGVTMTMKDISFGVTKDQVTFDPNKYASAKVVDKRDSK